MTDPITLNAQEGTPYLAVDVQPDSSGRGDFVLDASTLDGIDLLGYWGSDWLNVVCDVQEVAYRRGATRLQGPLTRAEVGTCTVTLTDTERRFDPTLNADAIHKGTPFRVRAWGYADTYEPVENRRNLVPNANGTTLYAWAGGAVGATSVASYLTGETAFPTGTAMRYTVTVPAAGATSYGNYAGHTLSSPYEIDAVPGEVYSGAMYVRWSVALPAVRASLAFYDAAGVVLSSYYGLTSSLDSNTVKRFAVNGGTAPANAVRVRVRVLTNGNVTVPAGTTLDCSAAQIERAATAGPYFDGNTAPTGTGGDMLTYAWEGTPTRSQSVEFAQQFLPMNPWEAVLFTGRVDDVGVAYSKTDAPEVTVSAVDLIGDLAAWSAVGRPAPGVGAGDTFRERVIRVLVEMGLAPEVSTELRTTYVAINTVPAATTAAIEIQRQIQTTGFIHEDWSWTGMSATASVWASTLRGLYEPTRTDRIRAADEIAGRMRMGAFLFEDWSWYGMPAYVGTILSGGLQNEWLISTNGGGIHPQVWLTQLIRTHEVDWLQAYIVGHASASALSTIVREHYTDAALVAQDSDLIYDATLTTTVLAKAWADITTAQDAELGRLWVNTDGKLAIRGRRSELSGTVRGTLSDIHGETAAVTPVHCCYIDPSVVFGTEMMTNRAIAARRDPAGGTPTVVQVDDEYSAARYGLRATDMTLDVADDAQLTRWARELIAATTEPELRVDRVTPAPWSSPDAWPAVCATDIGDRWAFRLHPTIGPAVDRAVGVLGVEASLTPAGWDITWHTTDAPNPGSADTGGWFTLNASTLDEADLLAPFSGIAA